MKPTVTDNEQPNTGRRSNHLCGESSHRLYLWLCSIAVALCLVACGFALDSYFFRPVRQMDRIPGVKLYGWPEKSSYLRDEVLAIEFNEVHVTAEHIQTARQFPNLRQLTFSSCSIPREALAGIADLTRLRDLSFENCDMNVGLMVSKCEALPKLKHLCIEDMNVQPGDFKDLKHYVNLDVLLLKGTNVESEHIRDIAKAPLIKTLDLSRTEISDDEIAAIVEADVFQSILFKKTRLTDVQVAQLCRCRSLTYLCLWDTDVSASVISDIGRSRSLEAVGASGTPLGSGFDEKRLSNGCLIYGSGEKKKMAKSE